MVDTFNAEKEINQTSQLVEEEIQLKIKIKRDAIGRNEGKFRKGSSRTDGGSRQRFLAVNHQFFGWHMLPRADRLKPHLQLVVVAGIGFGVFQFTSCSCVGACSLRARADFAAVAHHAPTQPVAHRGLRFGFSEEMYMCARKSSSTKTKIARDRPDTRSTQATGAFGDAGNNTYVHIPLRHQ